MKIYEFGESGNSVIVLLPGTCCYWKANFGEVIPLLQKSFRVCCVSYDGFDETESTTFPTMLEETERIEERIRTQYGGHVCAIYGCSLGGSFVGLLASRGNITFDRGILGSSDLDQAGKLKTNILIKIGIPMIYPLIHDGEYKKGFMKKRAEKSMAENGEYGKKFMGMMKGPDGNGMPFVSKESVANQFGSDMVTALPDNIKPKRGEIHIFYALKMGEKYRARYLKHFAEPVIHEFDLKHEELLACYPEKWVEEIEKICASGCK